MKTCGKTSQQLTAFVLGYLSQQQVSEITHHLVVCEECRGEVKELGKLLECAREISEVSADEQLSKSAKEAVLAAAQEAEKTGPRSTINMQNAWRTVMKSRITKLAAAAVLIAAVIFGLDLIGGPDMTSVAWGEVVKKVEQIESFIFQHQISITSVPEGTTIQEIETTTYVSLKHGLRQDAYMDDQVIGISYIPLEGTIVTQVMPNEKKYRKVTTSEEHMRKIHDQSNPKGMIKEFMSFEHTKLGRKIIDGVEAEGIELNDPDFLSAVFESVVGRLWVDVETNLPLRTEIEGVSGDGSIETKIVAYDFDWDAEPEPSVFEPNIPDDYTLLEK
jgi:hypothetical protein